MTSDHLFHDATQACWVPIFRQLAVSTEPKTPAGILRRVWRRLRGTAFDPLEPALGDPARNIYNEVAPRCTRCGAKFQSRPTGSAHPTGWRVCRSCAQEALTAIRSRRGIRLVEAPAPPPADAESQPLAV